MKSQILLRLDVETEDRLNVLVDLMAANPELSGVKVTKSLVHRKVLLAGLEALEAHYALAPKKR